MNKGGGYQDFPSKNFSLTVPKNFAGQLCCAVFLKSCGSENFMNKGGGGEHQDFPSKNFSLTVPKNFVGQLCCAVFQKYASSKNYMNKGGGEYQNFQSKKFSLTVPKTFAGESSTASLIQVSKIVRDKREGAGIKTFRRKFFLSHSVENFVEQPFCAVFQKFSGSEKVYG